MRVVNMAHGSFFLLGGYIALQLQRDLVGEGGALRAHERAGQRRRNWIVPRSSAPLLVGVIGLLMQQLFLRWNQGQDLRQALITIAISVILADQMLAQFGGIAKDIAWPRHVRQVRQPPRRGHPVPADAPRHPRRRDRRSASGLWLWLKRTRTGKVMRAGVDDRAMVSALGINIQLVFAVAFFVGSALAGLGGVIGGSFASLAPGVDANWLLNSLIVVIIGGMGSLGGAAIGALLLGLTTQLRRRVPAVGLHLLLDHLHVRAARGRARGAAARPVREARVKRRRGSRRIAVVGSRCSSSRVLAPLLVSATSGSARC